MTSNCPACGAPLGNSTTACPFCGYALAGEPAKVSSDELYNPPIEAPRPPAAPEVEPVVEAAPEPEPQPVAEPAYTPPQPNPVAQVAAVGQKVRKTGGKIAIGIIIAVVVICVLCVVVVGYALYWFFTTDYSSLMPALAQLPAAVGLLIS